MIKALTLIMCTLYLVILIPIGFVMVCLIRLGIMEG